MATCVIHADTPSNTCGECEAKILLNEARTEVEKQSQAARQRSKCVTELCEALDKARIELKDANLQSDVYRKALERIMKEPYALSGEIAKTAIHDAAFHITNEKSKVAECLCEQVRENTYKINPCCPVHGKKH